MLRFAVLQHTTPDGAWHFDWLIEARPSTGPDDRSLLSFRTTSLPTESPAFEAERIADHRAHYLDFQGDIGQGRGMVQRAAAGKVEARWEGPRLLVRCLTSGGAVHLEGASGDGVHFHFTRHTGPA